MLLPKAELCRAPQEVPSSLVRLRLGSVQMLWATFLQEAPSCFTGLLSVSCVGGGGVDWRVGGAAGVVWGSTPGGLEWLGSLGRCAWAQGMATGCRGYCLCFLGVLKP